MFVNLPGEEWLPVEGYDGLYEVSNMGRVRSWSTRGSHIRKPSVDPHLICQEKNWRGAMSVTFQRGREHHARGVLVHAMVAAAFIGPRPVNMLVRHKDGDPGNNTATNLAYGTQLDNMADAFAHGTIARGSRLPQAKLNEEKVLEIRILHAAGEKIRILAERNGISWATCQDVILGVSWSHVGGPIEVR